MNNNLFFTQNMTPHVYSMQPDSWEAVEQAINMLKSGQVVLFNLEGLPRSFAERLTDFTAGCLCAIAGHQIAIGRDVFLFCPPNVKLSVDKNPDTNPQILIEHPIDQPDPSQY